jgi:hypothetical protein
MRALIGSLAGSRSLIGEDYANNYGASFTGASNFGYGFNAWDFTINGIAGGFIGSSAGQGFGNIDTSGVSFGVFGNPAGNSADIKRNLPANLSLGYALSASIAVNFRNGNKGFSAYSDTGWSQEVFNFNVGSNAYTINGVSTGQAYSSTMIARIVLKKANTSYYSYSVTLGSTLYTENDITYNGFSNIRGFKFYVSGTEAGNANNLFFNSLKVYKIPEPVATQSSTFTAFIAYE